MVGGGITGLVAAHTLHSRGATPVLIERSARLGGKVLTENVDGFIIEAGPDSFVAAKGSVVDLAAELGIADRIISSRTEHRGSYVWWRNRLHPLPDGLLLMAPSRLGPMLGTSLLSPRGKLRLLADLFLPRRDDQSDESLESFVTRRLGREVLDRIAEPLIAGIHASEPRFMSLQASFPRFPEMEREYRSLILAARAMAKRPTPAGGLSYFASFRAGMGELTTALLAEMTGVGKRLGVAVTRLIDDAGRYRLDLSDRTTITADGVVLAAPARDAAVLLTELSLEAGEAVAAIGQVATATVTVAYRAGELPSLRGSGFVVPAEGQRRILGVSYLSQKWGGRVPDDRFALMRAFVGGPRNQELALADEEHLESVVLSELATLVGITAQPLLRRVHRWEGGLHQYTLGHLDRVADAESALAAHPGVALAGAAFHGIGLNECVSSGRRAAEKVLAGISQANRPRFRSDMDARSSGSPISGR